ncbi:MAG: hypothetical protein GY851_02745, partial [bacterium]|nr:hypothetical protein [bacterium]
MVTKPVLLLAFTAACSVCVADPVDPQSGLIRVFFDDIAMSRPNSMAVADRIDLDTGTTINDCAYVWMGYVVAPVAGEMTFFAEADNGLRLFLDGKAVIDGWGEGLAREGEFRFAAEGEAVPLRLTHFQFGGSAHMRLYWSWPGHPRELIPADAFRHDARDLQAASDMLEGPMNAEEVPLTESGARLHEPGAVTASTEPIPLGRGPHLFIDDFLIASSENVRRVVNTPERDPAIPNPIVTGIEDGCFQPYVSVVRDPDSRRFRMWYGRYTRDRDTVRSRIGYMESHDGI